MVGRRIAGEYVVVPLAGRGVDLDSILNFNPVGTLIWEMLDGRRTGEDVVAAIVGRFDVDPDRAGVDYLDFLSKLKELKAIRLVTPAT